MKEVPEGDQMIALVDEEDYYNRSHSLCTKRQIDPLVLIISNLIILVDVLELKPGHLERSITIKVESSLGKDFGICSIVLQQRNILLCAFTKYFEQHLSLVQRSLIKNLWQSGRLWQYFLGRLKRLCLLKFTPKHHLSFCEFPVWAC